MYEYIKYIIYKNCYIYYNIYIYIDYTYIYNIRVRGHWRRKGLRLSEVLDCVRRQLDVA
jgi:hypothetical protein